MGERERGERCSKGRRPGGRRGAGLPEGLSSVRSSLGAAPPPRLPSRSGRPLPGQEEQCRQRGLIPATPNGLLSRAGFHLTSATAHCQPSLSSWAKRAHSHFGIDGPLSSPFPLQEGHLHPRAVPGNNGGDSDHKR